MQLSKNFTLEEFIRSQTASRYKINNTPTKSVIDNLQALSINILQPVRDYFQRPVVISSGYRCPDLNRLIKGSKNSQHLKGEAADFTIPGIRNDLLADWIRFNLDFDQLILEFCSSANPYAGWVHCSYSTNINRKNLLTINSRGSRTGLVA